MRVSYIADSLGIKNEFELSLESHTSEHYSNTMLIGIVYQPTYDNTIGIASRAARAQVLRTCLAPSASKK